MKRLPLLLLLIPFFTFGQEIEISKVNFSEDIREMDKSCVLGVYRDHQGSRDNICKIGDYFPDLTIYTQSGKPFRILEELRTENKPILLMAGSYSCPVFRRHIKYLNQLNAKYGSDIDMYVVYTIEAHPSDVSSPYRDSIWIHDDNYKEQVFIPQDTDFEGRVKTSKQLQKDYQVRLPILLDGPKNRYWELVGQMPNFVYLLLPGGRVVDYQPWIMKDELEQACIKVVRRIDRIRNRQR